jgi:hypothetical protein
MLDSLRQMPSWQRAGETGPPVDLYETDKAVIIRLVLAHSRRRLVHFNVTEHPTAEWMARQLLDACALEEGPRYLIGLRQNLWRAIFASGPDLGIQEAGIAPRSPWQNAYAERVIGSIRRECLDHLVVISERHLREILSKYVDYYNATRTHLSLAKDAPEPRRVQLPSQDRHADRCALRGRAFALRHEYGTHSESRGAGPSNAATRPSPAHVEPIC